MLLYMLCKDFKTVLNLYNGRLLSLQLAALLSKGVLLEQSERLPNEHAAVVILPPCGDLNSKIGLGNEIRFAQVHDLHVRYVAGVSAGMCADYYQIMKELRKMRQEKEITTKADALRWTSDEILKSINGLR